MNKNGFEMSDEERALKVLDTVLDIATAQFTERFVNSVLTIEESNKLAELLVKANGITSKALEEYEEDCNESSCLLRKITEDDLQEISNMTHYRDNDIVDDNDKKIGVNHMYCNEIELEGTEEFITKNLYVFHNGRVLTEA